MVYGLVVCLLVVVGGVYYGGERAPSGPMGKGKSAKKNMGPAVVTTTTIKTGTLVAPIEAVGVLEADTSVTLKARVDGQVSRVWFQEGQQVRQGETLFTLDNRGFEAQLRQAQANLERDRVLLAKAEQDLRRSRELASKDLATREKLDSLQSEVAALTATLTADQAQGEHARLMLGYATITSPIDGVAGDILAQLGNTVRQNDTTLVVINRIQPIQVRFSVPEKWLPKIQSQMHRGSLPVRVVWRGEGEVVENGEVVFINNTVDPTTGTLALKASLPNQGKRLLPGQFVRVTLAAGENSGLLVPAQAVQFGQKGAYLYRVIGGEVAERQKVEVLAEHQEQMIIAGPVAAGDTVVLDGHLRVVVGEKLRIAASGK